MSNSVLIISTRLPLSVSKENGKLVFNNSPGGLATGVASLRKSRDSKWIGWPGIAREELTDKDIIQIQKEFKKNGLYPVFLTKEQIELFYSGYSNAVLWPLFHYFPNKVSHSKQQWTAYREVNQLFADATKELMSADTSIWVHDYQLMLVPEMLRKDNPSATIGFFLHTPFPAFEVFRLIPERAELLRGLLGANLVGFHSYDYVKHFLDSVLAILGHENNLGSIRVGGRLIKTDAFPIGIDYQKFAKTSKTRRVSKILKSFNILNKKMQVVLAVDRADYSKGIPERLDAYEQFLEKYPKHHHKVVLVVVAVPTRSEVQSYKELRDTIEQKISRINGRFSTIDWTPIVYRYQALPFDELSALYATADVMLVTPLRDGMNLVAKEYVASRQHNSGVLILSEMAGAASELPEALLVNPHDSHQIAETINTALSMKSGEQKQRLRKMQERIAEYTIKQWASDFMAELIESVEQQRYKPKHLTDKQRVKMLHDYEKSHKRLILLDYDGTLRDFVSSPSTLLGRPTRQVKKILKTLTKDPRNHVIIISGRPRNTLENYFKNNKLGLIAEHGGWVFDASGWIKASVGALKWKKDVRPTLEKFTARTPGSEIEEKDFSLVWHYRNVSPDLAYVRKQELQKKLKSEIASNDIGVFEGDKILEIKPKRMNKGVIVTHLLAKEDWDFIVAVGDDYTDEDMFEALPDNAYSIKVGMERTSARFQINNVEDVVRLVSHLQ